MRKVLLTLLAIGAIALMSCDTGDDGAREANAIKLASADRTLYYDGEFQIDATSLTPITYTSEDEYHASVSASGLVTAGRIGETNIVLTNGKDTKKVKITVKPESNLYSEPDLTFGMSRSAVIAKLGTPYPADGDDRAMMYINWSVGTPALMCIFDEFDRLEYYIFMVETAYSSELVDFLVERYALAAMDEDGDVFAIFLNALDVNKADMAVGLRFYDSSYIMAMYTPAKASDTRTSIIPSDIMKSVDEIMGAAKFE